MSQLKWVKPSETRRNPRAEPAAPTSSALYLTPLGLGLSRLFEKHMGKSFTETTPVELQELLPRLFDELEITKNMLILLGPDRMKVEIRNHIFKDLLQEKDKLYLTIGTVGSPSPAPSPAPSQKPQANP